MNTYDVTYTELVISTVRVKAKDALEARRNYKAGVLLKRDVTDVEILDTKPLAL